MILCTGRHHPEAQFQIGDQDGLAVALVEDLRERWMKIQSGALKSRRACSDGTFSQLLILHLVILFLTPLPSLELI